MAELDGSSAEMSGSQAAGLKRRSVAGLNGLNFFIADMLTGFGPFVTIYLTANGWHPTHSAFRHCHRQTVSVILTGRPWIGRSQNLR